MNRRAGGACGGWAANNNAAMRQNRSSVVIYAQIRQRLRVTATSDLNYGLHRMDGRELPPYSAYRWLLTALTLNALKGDASESRRQRHRTVRIRCRARQESTTRRRGRFRNLVLYSPPQGVLTLPADDQQHRLGRRSHAGRLSSGLPQTVHVPRRLRTVHLVVPGGGQHRANALPQEGIAPGFARRVQQPGYAVGETGIRQRR